MPIPALASLSRLSDADLVDRLQSLAAREREATAELVAHLAELDTRDIHLRAGYPSLFAYCREVLRLSEHEAYNRIEAARAARRFPVILDHLAERKVHLTTIRLLAPHLTPDNHQAVLDSARGKRKTGVQEIVARLVPRPDAASILRRLPAPKPALTAPPEALAPPDPAARPLGPESQPVLSQPVLSQPVLSQPVLSAPRSSTPVLSVAAIPAPVIQPLSPDRYKVQFTVGAETVKKLRRAKDLLRHAVPSGDDAAIFDRALTALLADLEKKKLAATRRPRPSAGSKPSSRHIPAEVKRAVWQRDRERCAFVGTGGHRCDERAFLELHHLKPYAVGGEATVTNLELRCRRHNQHEAMVYFAEARAYLPESRSTLSKPRAPGQLVLERVEG
jgi:hypothetical protein